MSKQKKVIFSLLLNSLEDILLRKHKNQNYLETVNYSIKNIVDEYKNTNMFENFMNIILKINYVYYLNNFKYKIENKEINQIFDLINDSNINASEYFTSNSILIFENKKLFNNYKIMESKLKGETKVLLEQKQTRIDSLIKEKEDLLNETTILSK